MKTWKLAIAAALAAGSISAQAYEVETHAVITGHSWNRLTDADLDLFRRLGLRDVENAFGTQRYYNLLNGQPRVMNGLVWDATQMPAGVPPYSVLGWLMRGAIREDDDPFESDPSPKNDDPDPPEIHHVLRHFFDPLRNIPLTSTIGLTTQTPCESFQPFWSGDPPAPCAKAIDWALGTTDYRVTPFRPDPARRNHYTVVDAREAMYRALTGHNAAFTDVGSSIDVRNPYWATTFRVLGDVLHLNQDMAQPQHTRNDQHAGSLGGFNFDFLGQKSTLEKWVESAVKGWGVMVVGTTPQDIIFIGPETFDFEGSPAYPTPIFANYADYWTTPTFKGLADYSNRGFFTPGTNLGKDNSPYGLPNRVPTAYASEFVDPVRWNGSPVPNAQGAKVEFLRGIVNDANQPTMVKDIRMSASSPWDQFLQPIGRRKFTLLHENYQDQVSLLLPRATAYSAGLLGYFFRGKLKIDLPAERVYAVEDYATYANANAGFKKFKVRIKNVTDAIDDGTGTSTSLLQDVSTDGTVVAVIRYRRNACLKQPSLEGVPGSPTWNESCRQPDTASQVLPNILVSDRKPAPAGMNADFQEVGFTFDPPLPFDATDVDLQVVYRGPLGSEDDGIAVGFEFLSEPSFMNFDNNNDCLKPTQCTPTSTDDACTFGPVSVPLPFTFAGGQPNVVSVPALLPGQHSRVAFITYAAYVSQWPDGYFVVRNQDYTPPVEITLDPFGVIATWGPGPSTTPFQKSRKLTGSFPNMYAYDGIGTYGFTCASGDCSGFQWAAENCAAPIDPNPQPVISIIFPTPP